MRTGFTLIAFLQMCLAEWGHPPHWIKENSKLKSLQVVCGKEYMTVYVEFHSPFEGLIFSKGKYGQSSCVYVTPHSGVTHANFDVYYDQCGTKPDHQAKFYENTIIIQYGTDVIEAWDEAKRLRCEWYNAYEKPASKPGIKIADIEVVELEFQGDNVDCWMEIQEGKGPWSRQVSGIIPIGSPLTMVIAINDHQGQFDMRVKSCQAYNRRKIPVALTDENGCVLRPKMLTPFLKVRDYNGRATVISYSHFYAFKFPDTMDVHVQCKVEICRQGCPESCPGQIHKPSYQESKDSVNYIKPSIINEQSDLKVEKGKLPTKQENLPSNIYVVHSGNHQSQFYKDEKVSEPQLVSHIINKNKEQPLKEKEVVLPQLYINYKGLHPQSYEPGAEDPTPNIIHSHRPETDQNESVLPQIPPDRNNEHIPPELAQHAIHYVHSGSSQSFQNNDKTHSSEGDSLTSPHLFPGLANFQTKHRLPPEETPPHGPVYLPQHHSDTPVTKHNEHSENYNPGLPAFLGHSQTSLLSKIVEHVTPKSTTIVAFQPVYFIQPQRTHPEEKATNHHQPLSEKHRIFDDKAKFQHSSYPYPIPQFMPRHPMYGMSQISDRMDRESDILPLAAIGLRPAPRSIRHHRSTKDSEFGVHQTYLAIAYNDLDFDLNSTDADTPIYGGKSEEIIYGICLSVSNFAACLSLLMSLILCSVITALCLFYRINHKPTGRNIVTKSPSEYQPHFYRVRKK